MNKLSVSVLVVLSAATMACSAVPQSWKIQLQCRSSDGMGTATFNLPANASLLNQAPSISADGSVAVRTTFTSGPIQDGYFRGSGGTGSLITSNSGGAGYSSADLDLTDAHMLCPRSGGAALEVHTSIGSLDRVFDAPNAEGITVFTRGRLVPDGVGYRGTTNAGARRWVIDRVINSQRVQTVYLADGLGTNLSFLYPPTTNTALQMGGKIDDQNGSSAIVRLDAPGSMTVVIDSSAPDLDLLFGATDMNASGTMAFIARYATGSGTEVRLHRAGVEPVGTIATSGDLGIEAASMSTFPPAISDNGWVAFRGRDVGGDALFIGDGTILVRVVGTGSTMNTDLGPIALGFSSGGGVQSLSGPIDINASGHIVFIGVLANGTLGLFTAEPCRADFNNDGVVDLFDYLDFVEAFAAEESEADFNADGTVDLFDYLDYVQAFADGC